MNTEANHEPLPENLRQALAVLDAKIDAVAAKQAELEAMVIEALKRQITANNAYTHSIVSTHQIINHIEEFLVCLVDGASKESGGDFGQEKSAFPVNRMISDIEQRMAGWKELESQLPPLEPPAGPGDVPPERRVIMNAQNPEARLAALEIKHEKLLKFCVATLLIKLHQLDKNMALNLGDLARAIKEPERFDLDGYLKQIDHAGFDFDQMDAALNDALKKLNADQKPPTSFDSLAGPGDVPPVPPVPPV